MGVIFDKKKIRKIHKIINGNRKKYAVKTSIIASVVYLLVGGTLDYLIDPENFQTKNEVLELTLKFIVFFFIMYFILYYNWRYMKKDYDDTIQYFEKNDPSFLDDILKEK